MYGNFGWGLLLMCNPEGERRTRCCEVPHHVRLARVGRAVEFDDHGMREHALFHGST